LGPKKRQNPLTLGSGRGKGSPGKRCWLQKIYRRPGNKIGFVVSTNTGKKKDVKHS